MEELAAVVVYVAALLISILAVSVAVYEHGYASGWEEGYLRGQQEAFREGERARERGEVGEGGLGPI